MANLGRKQRIIHYRLILSSKYPQSPLSDPSRPLPPRPRTATVVKNRAAGGDMRKLWVVLAVVGVLVAGCGFKLMDTPYTPQSIVTGHGELALGQFTYSAPPENQHDVKWSPGWCGFNEKYTVPEYIRRAHALELKNCGFTISESAKTAISANINSISIKYFGFGAEVKYSVTYTVDKSGERKEYTYDLKRESVTNGTNYMIPINAMVMEGIEMLIKESSLSE